MKSLDLPKAVYFKDGGYYFVRRNKWHFLGNDRDMAIALHRRILHGLDPAGIRFADRFAMDVYMRTVLHRAKKNARTRRIPFDLTREQFVEIVKRANGRCEVTGIAFELDIRPGSARRPFAPSLDRIQSAGQYTAANCRLVCGIVNAALSDWGEGVFWKMVKMSRRIRGHRAILGGACPGN